jgi:hypothetical protein
MRIEMRGAKSFGLKFDEVDMGARTRFVNATTSRSLDSGRKMTGRRFTSRLISPTGMSQTSPAARHRLP